MQTGDRSPKKSSFFYGWVILAACLGINAVIHGIRYSFGVFFKSISGQFDLSRGATAGITSTYFILCALFGLLGGFLMDKYGARKVMLPMGIITGISLIATSQATAGWQLYLTYSLLLAAGTGAVYSVLMTTAQRWFIGRRGTAIGIVSSGVGVGTLIMTPLSAWLIAQYGWRQTFFGMGIVLGLIMVVLALFLKKEPAASLQNRTAGGDIAEPEQTQSFTLSQAMKTANYWLLATIWFCWSFSVLMVMTHLVPHLTDIGVESTTAAFIGGLIGIISIAGRLGIGWISDRIGRRPSIILTVLLQAGALYMLAWSTQIWLFYVFAVVFAIGYGGLDPATLGSIGDIFGLRNLGKITGGLTFFFAVGAACGSAAGGLIYDATGSYFLAFLLTGILMTIAAICALFIKKRKLQHG